MIATKREVYWKSRRVFFMTPQVLQNDLARGSCYPNDIVCLVFDEAHRALGHHAYSQVIDFFELKVIYYYIALNRPSLNEQLNKRKLLLLRNGVT